MALTASSLCIGRSSSRGQRSQKLRMTTSAKRMVRGCNKECHAPRHFPSSISHFLSSQAIGVHSICAILLQLDQYLTASPKFFGVFERLFVRTWLKSTERKYET